MVSFIHSCIFVKILLSWNIYNSTHFWHAHSKKIIVDSVRMIKLSISTSEIFLRKTQLDDHLCIFGVVTTQKQIFVTTIVFPITQKVVLRYVLKYGTIINRSTLITLNTVGNMMYAPSCFIKGITYSK